MSLPAERVIVAAEKLHGAAEAVRRWARGYLPGELPAPLQDVVDAADMYAEQLDEYEKTRAPINPKK